MITAKRKFTYHIMLRTCKTEILHMRVRCPTINITLILITNKSKNKKQTIVKHCTKSYEWALCINTNRKFVLYICKQVLYNVGLAKTLRRRRSEFRTAVIKIVFALLSKTAVQEYLLIF